MIMLHFAIITLPLFASVLCNQDGDQWLHCKPRDGCSLAKCDPMQDPWFEDGGSILNSNEYTIRCRQRETTASGNVQLKINEQQEKISELMEKLNKLERRVERTEDENDEMKLDTTTLKTRNVGDQSNGQVTNKIFPRNCKEINGGGVTGGVFAIFPDLYKNGIEVYCDLASGKGGWTMFQRRKDGSVNFNRNWKDYVNGFGRPDGEYWMGLEKLHRLTSDGRYELRVDLGDWKGNRAYAEYSTFSVAGASDKYRLRVGGYSGNAGDSLNEYDNPAYIHNNQIFSTYDNDNDKDPNDNCAKYFKGGWWFNNCYNSHLNGIHHDPSTGKIGKWEGIIWEDWRDDVPLEFSEMKFRRKN